MNEEKDVISSLISQSKNIGYYTALIYGAGYVLTTISTIIAVIELIARMASIPGAAMIWQNIPAWLYAGLIVYFLGIICAILLGLSIVKSAKVVRMSGLSFNAIASSVSIFTYMLIFYGIGAIIITAGINSMQQYFQLSYISPIFGIVGPVLLLVGFRIYRSRDESESKLIGCILMLVAAIFIYNLSRQIPDFGTLRIPLSIPIAGPLLSSITLEFIAVLLAIIAAMLYALKIFDGGLQQTIISVILTISGILFSIGLIHFNFSTASTISNINNILKSLGVYGFPIREFYSLWIVLIGLIILGIAGIFALITSIIPLAFAVKQLSAQIPVAPPPPPPPPSTETKQVQM